MSTTRGRRRGRRDAGLRERSARPRREREHREHLPVVALASVHPEQAHARNGERSRGFVELRRMHREAPQPGRRQQVVAKLLLARGTPPGERHGPWQIAGGPETAAGHEAAHAAEPEPERNREPGHVRRLPERERVAFEEQPRRPRGAEEPAVVRESARPELCPRKAVGTARMADTRGRVPDSAVRGREAIASLDAPDDLRGVSAQVHVVPEVAVGDHMEHSRADHAGQKHRQAQIDDDVCALAHAACPERARGGRKQEPRQEQDEVRGERDPEQPEQIGMHGAVRLRSSGASAVRFGRARR